MTYRAPVRDIALALRAAGLSDFLSQTASDLDEETAVTVLEAAGSLIDSEFAPLNRKGDLIGAKHDGSGVVAVPGFAQAYKAFADGGWNALAADPAHGGQGLPKALEFSVFEMAQAANASLALCPMLT